MTIEELLKAAEGACWLMETEMTRDRGTAERAAQYGQIAQGYAQTAQAMILASMRTKHDSPALRIFGEVNAS